MSSSPPNAEPSPNKPPLKDRLKQLMVEYGWPALGVYLGIFAIVLVGFALAIRFGLNVESSAGTAGVWVAAWLSTKSTQPLRILATLALTPVIMRVLRRIKRRPPPGAAPTSVHVD
jgi:hypothetical protein